MVGRVVKTRMYSHWAWLHNIPDIRAARIWLTRLRHDKRPFAMLNATADMLEEEGIRLIDSTTYTQDQLVTPGVLTRTQPSDAQMLDALWSLLAPGGRLLYGTCSVLNDENQRQVDAFLARTPDASAQPLDERFGHASGAGRQRFPGEDGMDGFFYALMRKAR